MPAVLGVQVNAAVPSAPRVTMPITVEPFLTVTVPDGAEPAGPGAVTVVVTGFPRVADGVLVVSVAVRAVMVTSTWAWSVPPCPSETVTTNESVPDVMVGV